MVKSALKIEGGYPLYGEITSQRAKNAVLPMIAAALIPEKGETVLHGVPTIEDVRIALELARSTGAKVDHDPDSHTVVIDASGVRDGRLAPEFTQKMRGSVLFLAPLLLRAGYVELPGSGGCDIGTRKIDFHHRGFARLGAEVRYDEDGTTVIDLHKRRFQGTMLYLDMPSHTGTENLMMGAALAEGETIIENASVEPEVIDFGSFLNKMGARIHGLGTATLYIEGVKQLQPVEYRPIPDRLVIGALMMSTGITGGEVVIRETDPTQMRLVIAKLEQMGVDITVDSDGSSMIVRRDPDEALSPINITTHPYPGFPTDLQPCIAALSTIARGTSYIRERIFENRYDFVSGLLTMGADILISQSDVCVITGVNRLRPAHIEAPSIRAGASLLLAALAARGTTTIENAYQIDRGHERIEDQLTRLGGHVTRIYHQAEPLTTLDAMP